MLAAPATGRVAKAAVPAGSPRRAPGAPALRRDRDEDFAREFGEGDEEYVPRRVKGVRFRFLGGMPRSIVGRVITAVAALAGLVGFTAGLWEVRSRLLHDPRLVIASSSSVQITGNSHMTRAQLLSVFGEDVDRNILAVPLAGRRAELEQLPWVEHATVMRLLPNELRVAVKERTPVAFVRQSGTIGLVDANGVLLDMGPDAPVEEHYSFPVVTGISGADPLSVRAARMKMYGRFMEEMDAASKDLSEVDLSDPEDVKALVPSAGSDILVHFGETDFLHRYKVYAAHVGEWKTANPRLASVDMRYEHQVVLEMAKPAAGESAAPGDPAKDPTSQKQERSAGSVQVSGHPTVAKKQIPFGNDSKVDKPVSAGTAVPGSNSVAPVAADPKVPAAVKAHLQTAFDVPSTKKTPVQAGPPK